MKSGVTGTILAMAAATMFLAGAANAQEAAGSSSSSGAKPAQVKCMGGNDCSGQSACKTATSQGPHQNSCKGQGFLMTSTEKECKDKGGHAEKM